MNVIACQIQLERAHRMDLTDPFMAGALQQVENFCLRELHRRISGALPVGPVSRARLESVAQDADWDFYLGQYARGLAAISPGI